MKNCKLSLVRAVLLVFALFLTPAVWADVELAHVFGSHMVLQRDRPLPIWGWADPGEQVHVQLDAAIAAATADAQGAWKVVLPAVTADGKSHRMTVRGKNIIELDDILYGDVWIGSGQSNMHFSVKESQNGEQAADEARDSRIRLFLVTGPKKETEPVKNVTTGGWNVCTPETVRPFSAVLYFFGQRLHKELDVPIGLVASSASGTQIELWIPAVRQPAAEASAKSHPTRKPGILYNGMIAPLQPMAILGALWYQGESNVNQLDGLMYHEKLKTLIESWRGAWGYEFPFYFVQLAPSAKYRSIVPHRDAVASPVLPPVWEAQACGLKVPGTGMAVTTDLVDDLQDFHPKNKFDVGNRLALWALAKTYHKDIAYSGPLYRSMQVDGGKIRLAFAHVNGGLTSRDNKPLTDFEIAGADGKFFPAEAAIDGDTIVVQAKQVSAPNQVRFGWRNDARPNLANKVGLPASAFQTDHWQGGTGE